MLYPPHKHHWADPFPVEKKDKTFVFFEELTSSTKGRIAFIEMNANGEHTKPQVILDTSFHLSYPYIFSTGNGSAQ